MSVLPDRELIKWGQMLGGVIPFEYENVNPASIDLRIGKNILDLRTGTEKEIEDHVVFEIVPGDAILATTVEYIKMPIDCCGVLYLKSSIARSGLDHALAGFVDPGFEGELTMELHSHRPVNLGAGQRIIQLVLYRMELCPSKPYSGRYQYQVGPTQAR